MKLNDRINILLMPTDSCNMDCVYCFNCGHTKNQGKMSIETLRRIYDITFTNFSDVTLVWHGGEPLMMGLEFYKKAIEMQKEYSGITIRNRIQTNLSLLDEKWIDFFEENRFGIGSSFDGVKNELTRGNTNKILSNSDLLDKRKINHSFIMVVSSLNIDTLIDSYLFYKEHKKNFTINMYLPTKKEDNLKLNPAKAIDSINAFFDYWLEDKECNIRLRYFEMFINFMLFQQKNVCSITSCLGRWIGIKYDGEIVPCNRYFPKEYSFGNVWKYEQIDQGFESEGFIKLISESIERREKCKSCNIFDMCAGGCNNVALVEGGVSKNGGDSCKILQGVYKHINERMTYLKTQGQYADLNPFVVKALTKYNDLEQKNISHRRPI